MKVTLLKQICGHCAGTLVGVSDDRAYTWMVNGFAKPDREFLAARKADTDRLLARAEKAERKARKAAKEEK